MNVILVRSNAAGIAARRRKSGAPLPGSFGGIWASPPPPPLQGRLPPLSTAALPLSPRPPSPSPQIGPPIRGGLGLQMHRLRPQRCSSLSPPDASIADFSARVSKRCLRGRQRDRAAPCSQLFRPMREWRRGGGGGGGGAREQGRRSGVWGGGCGRTVRQPAPRPPPPAAAPAARPPPAAAAATPLRPSPPPHTHTHTPPAP